jgi:rhodanese-related sulfurtransferase
LPDDLVVYPTHGAGSFCSSRPGGERDTTIGREKASNPLLAAGSEDAFVKLLLDSLGSYPPYFLRLRAVNRRGPHVYGPDPNVPPGLDVAAVDALVRDGAWLIDARPVERFAAGHIPGSVSIPSRDVFSTWLGWLVSDDTALVFVVDDDQDLALLVRGARNVGYERLAGTLIGGVDAWAAAGHPIAHSALAQAAGASGPIVDVRQRSEFDAGHIPGARNAELGALAVGDVSLPAGRLSVMCGHGERAMSAASLLERSHRSDITVLIGGPEDWAAAQRAPLERA